MHKIILIFIPFLIIFNSQCHLPPSQESQNKDFDQISTLIETSDRILNLKYLDEEIEFEVEGVQYISFKFLVDKKLKGSSEVNDEIFVTFEKKIFNNLFTNAKNEKLEINTYTDYTFFLIGRAKKNIFPKMLGGSLWFVNGTPSIYITNSYSIEIVSRIDILKNLSNEFQNINSLDKIKFNEIIKSNTK
ncbi:MAG: hypothetical protein P8K05_04610 [Dehalococcoidia bacterium]|nr:hypothetical protein [Dehalococcoidia bacterium]